VRAVVPSHSGKALLDMFWGNQVHLGLFLEQVEVGVVARWRFQLKAKLAR